MHKNINEQENKNEENKINIHGNTGEVSVKLNFTYSEINPSDGDDTHILSKHSNFDDDMLFFARITVQFLQNLYFIEL